MDTCTTLKSVSNHEIYVPLKLRLRFCLLSNYIKLMINDYDNTLNFNKCVSDIRAQEYMSEAHSEHREIFKQKLLAKIVDYFR